MKSLQAALLVALAPWAAQSAGAPPEGAGTILQQIQPVTPPAPSSTGTGLQIEQTGPGELPPTAAFPVTTIRISGNTLFDAETLHALVADGEGKNLTLPQLGELAARITEYYRAHGYPLARAIVPAQTIRDGLIDVQVIEARFGKILLDNRSRVTDPLLRDVFANLKGNAPIEESSLNRALLLLSDIPGIAVNATLKPGDTAGTSDLQVEAESGAAVTGNVTLDNYGNPLTGRERAGATLSLVDPLRHGDVLTVSGLTTGNEMRYGRIAYEWLLNGMGTRLGGSYSALHYALGGAFAPLQVKGTAQVDSLWTRHPFIRGQNANLFGQIEYDRKELRDHIDVSGISTDRHLGNWVASLIGDARDALFLSGAVNTWSLGWTSGRVTFDNAAAQLADAATAKTQGGFSKLNGSFARLQGLSPNNALYLSVSGQWTNGNLDPSEKMIAGGPYSVRAYDTAAVSGDMGLLATAEFRRDLGSALQGQWQAMAFADRARITVNKIPFAAGTNSATLSGLGVGLNWTGPSHWATKAYVATPVGSIPALVGATKSSRLWVEISKGF